MWFGFLDDESLRWSPAPERLAAWNEVKAAHASVVRAVVRWDMVARARPADAIDPFDPAYNFKDLDDFVINAQQRGIEVLLTIWGTPGWANADAGLAVPPTQTADFASFVHAVAERYSGTYPGLPFVRFYSIWNEPNTATFLQSEDPAGTYAALVEAGYTAVKSASPTAVVAIGETAASHSPGRFVDALAQADPNLPFDVWAHHPYPPNLSASPDTPRVWPNVGMRELGRLGEEVDRAFRRSDVPIWVTEFAEPTTYVSRARQASDLQRAVDIAAAEPQVRMFIWLMLRDHPGSPWQSGLNGLPAMRIFGTNARHFDPRNPLILFSGARRSFLVHVPALELRWHLSAGARVGIAYRVEACGRYVTGGMEAARMTRDGWVPVALRLAASPGVRYVVTVKIEDVHGFRITRTLQLVPAGGLVRGCASSAATRRREAAVPSRRSG